MVAHLPLHHGATHHFGVESLLALLKYGADANAQNDNQATPLHYAAALAGRQEAVEMVDVLTRPFSTTEAKQPWT